MVHDMNHIEEFAGPLYAISGPNHGGKDLGGDHLQKHHDIYHVSVSDILRAEADELDLEHTRSNLIDMGVRLRKIRGPSATVLVAIEMCQEARETTGRFAGGLVLSSVRVVPEAEEIINLDGTLVYVDAPASKRYGWGEGRDRGDENFSSFGEWLERDRIEIEGWRGADTPNLQEMRRRSHIEIWNDSTREVYLANLVASLGLAA